MAVREKKESIHEIRIKTQKHFGTIKSKIFEVSAVFDVTNNMLVKKTQIRVQYGIRNKSINPHRVIFKLCSVDELKKLLYVINEFLAEYEQELEKVNG